jgi:hypothetical protein
MVSINGCLDCFVINIRVLKSTRHKHIRRDVVRASNENWDAIQFQIERTSLAVQIRFLDPVDSSNTKPVNSFIHIANIYGSIRVFLDYSNFESVEFRLPDVPSPPELRLYHIEREIDIVVYNSTYSARILLKHPLCINFFMISWYRSIISSKILIVVNLASTIISYNKSVLIAVFGALKYSEVDFSRNLNTFFDRVCIDFFISEVNI